MKETKAMLSDKPVYPCGSGDIRDGEGMTLLQHYAGQILQGHCANPAVFATNGMTGWGLVNCSEQQLAQAAIGMAAVLIEELDKVNHGKPFGSQADVRKDSYVQPVPDHCDRITWRNRYYDLGSLVPHDPALRHALADMLSGWKYIREHHGDLYGVGWDRAQSAAEAALTKAAP